MRSRLFTSSFTENKYCSVQGKALPGAEIQTVFAATVDQCLSKCNRNFECLSVNYKTNQDCVMNVSKYLNQFMGKNNQDKVNK